MGACPLPSCPPGRPRAARLDAGGPSRGAPADGGGDVRRPGRRWRGHRRRNGPRRGGARAVRRPRRAARLGRWHVEPIEQAGPRRSALPRAEGLPAGPRGPARAPPADHHHRAAPRAAAAVPLPAEAPDLGARLRRRRASRSTTHWRAPRPPCPATGTSPGAPRCGWRRPSPRTRSPARSATTTPRSTTPGTPSRSCVRPPGWVPPCASAARVVALLKDGDRVVGAPGPRHRVRRRHRGARPRRHRRRGRLDDRLRDDGRGARARPGAHEQGRPPHRPRAPHPVVDRADPAHRDLRALRAAVGARALDDRDHRHRLDARPRPPGRQPGRRRLPARAGQHRAARPD